VGATEEKGGKAGSKGKEEGISGKRGKGVNRKKVQGKTNLPKTWLDRGRSAMKG